jgi:Fe(3+) dicitrate transport protein
MRAGLLLVTLALCTFRFTYSQTAKDSSSSQKKDSSFHSYLPEITVVGRGTRTDIHQLPEIVGTSIYAGKKNALIVLDNVQGNVVTNTMRQVMAKVPGIHVWESDGSGIQIGVAARGLSPNRSWEFNVRQNGYDIAADPYGYPEAYYNPQLQSVQRIEVVRGQGSLQYGPQFGGMINYILRNGSEINKPFEFETQQTVGSYGLFNSYNAVGGNTGKTHYYAFFDHRNADGWRQNSRYYTNAGFATITHRFTDKFSLTAEVMRSHIRSQQPGGLTDSLFTQNPQQSLRHRNWMDITWTTAALITNYTINDHQRINIKAFTVLGNRNSVGYTRALNSNDSINPATGTFTNRTVDIDNYRNAGLEARYLGDYRLGRMKNTLSGGIRLYRGTTYRYRNGKGTTGNEYSGKIDGAWPTDIDYTSINAAAFAESIFRVGKKIILIPGIRYEYIAANASGQSNIVNGQPVLLQNQESGRGFVLAGLGAEYHITSATEFYGNITQAYRPVQFADLTAPPTTDVVDPNLKDAKGHNVDIGYRGKVKNYLFFDVSGFFLQYNNRSGRITKDGKNFITNVGNSSSRGLELLVEIDPVKAFIQQPKYGTVSLFASYAYTHARYDNVKTKDGDFSGNRIEQSPYNILRSGLTWHYHGLQLTTQFNYVGDVYSDANNTVTPAANGQNGRVPAYTVWDISALYRFKSNYTIRTGINNAGDKNYFTRRAGGYPGPGILPADGRTFFISFGAKIN